MNTKHPNVEFARISAKGQLTVPAPIRKLIDAKVGDTLGFFVENDRVIVKKVETLDLEYYSALTKTLNAEWGSEADEQAYGDL